jgi:uncharacterized protein YndB with AHSA1/START domain
MMSNPMDRANPQQDVRVVVERILHAPRTRVFRAWTDPALLEKWFSPVDRTTVGVEANAVIGGRYRIGMRGPNGAVNYVSGIYIEIEPPQRLVFTWAWETDPPGGESLVTIEFFEQGDATRLVITHQKLETAQDRESHLHGWESCLQHLELKITNGEI